jgi:hypothetical protein
MRNLDNPRGLAFGPKGALYVAEAGHGGTGPCVTVRGAPNCYGPTGAITRLYKGKQERIVSGLPSVMTPEGPGGIHDLVVNKNGGLDATIGLGMDPALRGGFGPAGAGFGDLVHFRYGRETVLADVSSYERTANPDGGLIDTNPYGLLADANGWLVTDAGGNDLLRVGSDYSVSTVATFPSRPGRPTDAVPTSVAAGPGGTYYVSELTGVPFLAGGANIYRVTPGKAPEVFQSGLTDVMDIAVDSTGNLWVVELASATGINGPGMLLKIAPDSTRTTVAGDLVFPTSVALGPDGAVYVTNKGVIPASGEVLRIAP